MTTHTYVIEGEPCSGKNGMQIRWNRKTKRPFVAKSDHAAAWTAEAVAQLVRQRGRRRTLRGPVFVRYLAYQRRDTKDIDNIEAALFDALTRAKTIEDDRYIVGHEGWKFTDADRPRIVLDITPLTVPVPTEEITDGNYRMLVPRGAHGP